jgi:hypothetical protein
MKKILILIVLLTSYFSEAHYYLKINGNRIDITTQGSEFKTIKQDVIHELEIKADQVVSFKVDYHQKFIKNWINDTQSELSFDQMWHIREQCIKNLSN